MMENSERKNLACERRQQNEISSKIIERFHGEFYGLEASISNDTESPVIPLSAITSNDDTCKLEQIKTKKKRMNSTIAKFFNKKRRLLLAIFIVLLILSNILLITLLVLFRSRTSSRTGRPSSPSVIQQGRDSFLQPNDSSTFSLFRHVLHFERRFTIWQSQSSSSSSK